MSLLKLYRGLTLRSMLCSVVLIGATALITTQVMSQEYGDKKDAKAAGGHSDADMQKFMEMNKPGVFQQKLDTFAGTWNVKSKMWMDPSAPPTEGTGKSTFKWIVDRRYLQQEYEATSAMGPYKGMGVMGYDNMKKKYWNAWFCGMGTGAPMVSEGSSDGRTFTFQCEYDCPMTNKHMKSRQVTKIESPSKFTFEMYDTADGKETKSMEIVYTKA